jgi:hypothetical protein
MSQSKAIDTQRSNVSKALRQKAAQMDKSDAQYSNARLPISETGKADSNVTVTRERQKLK